MTPTREVCSSLSAVHLLKIQEGLNISVCHVAATQAADCLDSAGAHPVRGQGPNARAVTDAAFQSGASLLARCRADHVDLPDRMACDYGCAVGGGGTGIRSLVPRVASALVRSDWPARLPVGAPCR